VNKSLALLLAFLAVASMPSRSGAVALPYCDFIIPYQEGAGTNNQLGCYKMKAPWLCIAACKRKCHEHQITCNWELEDFTQCYMGCENGPKLPATASNLGAIRSLSELLASN